MGRLKTYSTAWIAAEHGEPVVWCFGPLLGGSWIN
jgi:hypothetical protein